MKIAVIASNGKASTEIVKEAQNRGLEVTGISRGSVNKSGAKTYIKKDILNLTKEDLAGFDVVVDGFGVFNPEELPLHVKTSQHLADILSGSDTRLLIVGGAGSLYVNPEHTVQLKDTPEFPEEFVTLATAQADELAEIRKRNDIKWTFVSPAADFDPELPRSGKYILAGEELTLNSKGESVISYADYAIAMVDEIEKGNHIQQRISVVGE